MILLAGLRRRVLRKIRGLIVFIQFSISVAIVVFFMYLFRNHTHKVIKIWMKIQMFFLGIKLEIEGNLDEILNADFYYSASVMWYFIIFEKFL